MSRLSSAEGGAGPENPAATPPASADEADAAAPPDDATAGRATPAESGASPEPGPGEHGEAPKAEASGAGGSPPADEPPPDTAAAESATPDTPEPQGTAPEASPPDPDVTPADDDRRALLDAFAAELGEDLVATEVKHDDVWLRVRPEAWRRTADVCRSLGFDYFSFLSGMDWMPSTAPSHKAAVATVDSDAADDEEAAAAAEATITADKATAAADEDATAASGRGAWPTGYAGGDTRFQVLARLYSTGRHVGVTLKADLDDDAPAVETWSTVYAGADWHERETWEMFGFDFVGHRNLTHLYLPGEFEGFPLRKDFPLLAREVKPWPGLVDVEPMPEEDEALDDPGGGS